MKKQNSVILINYFLISDIANKIGGDKDHDRKAKAKNYCQG